MTTPVTPSVGTNPDNLKKPFFKKEKRPTPPKVYKPIKPTMSRLMSQTTMKILERVPPEYQKKILNYELQRQLRAYERIVANPEEKLKTKSKYGLNIKNKLKYDWKKILDKIIHQEQMGNIPGNIKVPPKQEQKSEPKQEIKQEVKVEEKKEVKKEKIRVYKKTGLPLPPPKQKKLWIRGKPKPWDGQVVEDEKSFNPEGGLTLEEKKLKNPIFIKNVEDPLTHKVMEEIWCHKIMKPTQFKEYREKWDLVWQYYRDRNKRSVEETYQKYNNCLIKVKYLKSDKFYFMDKRSQEDKERYNKFVNDPTYTEQRHAEKSLPENWGKPKPAPLMPPPKKGEVKRIKMMKRILGKADITNAATIQEIKAILTKVPILEADVDLAVQKKNIRADDAEKLKHVLKTIIPDTPIRGVPIKFDYLDDELAAIDEEEEKDQEDDEGQSQTDEDEA